MNHIEKLDLLNIAKEDFAVFGSGPMAIRGLRENNDIDIVVRQKAWDELAKSNEVKLKENGTTNFIEIGCIEVFKEWKPWFSSVDMLIDEADVINGIRFVRLERLVEWKDAMGREKDKKDVEIISRYLKKQG